MLNNVYNFIMSYMVLNITSVFIFGMIFGLSELINRYPEMKYTFHVWQSYIYLLLNGLISVTALFLLKYFKGENLALVTQLEINNIIIAGLGGMMILRSSLFTIKHKDEKIEIGLGMIAQIFLDAIEKNMSANAAVIRMGKIDKLMEGIDFEKGANQLSALCISYIDNFSKEDEINLTKEIVRIRDYSDLNNHNKVLQLGRYISMYCNYNVLESAIKVLGDNIKVSEDSLPEKDNIEKLIKKLQDGKSKK